MTVASGSESGDIFARVIKGSAHLFGTNSISLGLSIVQSILAARLLGAAGFGMIGIVMSFASTVNGILSFRMGELVVRYGGSKLAAGEKAAAAAVIKAAAISESIVSLVAFLAVWLAAPIASRIFTKPAAPSWMFVIFALGLLANFCTETSTGVLQITDRVRERGVVNLIQSLLAVLIVIAALVLVSMDMIDINTTTFLVLLSYLAGKIVLGIGLALLAWRSVQGRLGDSWRTASWRLLPPLRELAGFALSTSLSATAILAFRESEMLWVGFLLNSEAAGIYKIAYMVVSLLSVPADPLILTVYPETNRLIAQRQWSTLRDLLKRITLLSAAYNMLLAVGLVFLGHEILRIFGPSYSAAYLPMLALLGGLVFNYIFFWNRPILLSFGLHNVALAAVVIAGIIKLVLAYWLVPAGGPVVEGLLLSLFYLISVGAIVVSGILELQRRMLRRFESHI